MFFSPFLASRYLKPKRTFVSIITVISILGVALGVWLLAVVIAVFTGYGDKIKENILGFEPHLVIDSGGIIQNWDETITAIEDVEGITSMTPYVRGQVVMDYQGLRSAPMIRGILQPEGKDLERMESKIATVKPPPSEVFKNQEKEPIKRNSLFLGNLVKWLGLDGQKSTTEKERRGKFFVGDPYSAVIGDGIAESQGITVGDKILLYSPRDIDAIMESVKKAEKGNDDQEKKKGFDEIREMTAPQELTITGIFDSGHWDFDSNIIFCNLETAQVLYNFDFEQAHGIAVRTEDGFQANRYQTEFAKRLPDRDRILTWMQMHQMIFNAVAAERQAMYLILFMIMIVGGFCIMNTMITVTYQKRGEIGLLKAIGAREGQIAWVFLFQGILVGLLGVLVGLALAEITIFLRNDLAGWVGRTFGVDMFSEEVYKIDGGLPAKQSWRDLTIISIGSFAACAIASLVPAILAASLQPAKALRSE